MFATFKMSFKKTASIVEIYALLIITASISTAKMNIIAYEITDQIHSNGDIISNDEYSTDSTDGRRKFLENSRNGYERTYQHIDVSRELSHYSPTATPSSQPSYFPTVSSQPTTSVNPTYTNEPTLPPSMVPSLAPSLSPSFSPSSSKMPSQSASPTNKIKPSVAPSTIPTFAPSLNPSTSSRPSSTPSSKPSYGPSPNPSSHASSIPTIHSGSTTNPPTFLGLDQLDHIATTLNGDLQSYGNMFDVRARKTITIRGLEILTSSLNDVYYEIRTMSGTYKQDDISQWTMVASGHVLGQGDERFTMLPFDDFSHVDLAAGDVRAFYVTLKNPEIIYNEGTNVGAVYAANADIEIMEGAGVITFPSKNQFVEPRLWLGAIYYDSVADDGESTAVPSSLPPSAAPSTAPSAVSYVTSQITYTFEVDAYPITKEMLDNIDSSIRLFLVTTFSGEENVLGSLGVDEGVQIISVGSVNYDEQSSNIKTVVTAGHKSSLSSGDVKFALLYYAKDIASAIHTEYIGKEIVHTEQVITLTGKDLTRMNSGGFSFNDFEDLTKTFLEDTVSRSSDVQILSVFVTGHNVTNDEESRRRLRQRRHNDAQINEASELYGLSSVDVTVAITGEYQPPPHVNLGELVGESFNDENSKTYVRELQKIPDFQNVTEMAIKPSPIPILQPVEDPNAEDDETKKHFFATPPAIPVYLFAAVAFLICVFYAYYRCLQCFVASTATGNARKAKDYDRIRSLRHCSQVYNGNSVPTVLLKCDESWQSRSMASRQRPLVVSSERRYKVVANSA